jgi:putative ABC transport system permease protein
MDPILLASTVRSEVRTIDPNLPVFAIRSMNEMLGGMMAHRRMNMILLSAFAAIAGGLAGIGLYGVMAYTVAQRSREIGVRVALGARRVDVLRMIIGDGFVLCAGGIVSGLAASAVLTRLMSSMLYNVSTTDALTFAITPALLMIVALVACYVPARRATRVDPIITLRDE